MKLETLAKILYCKNVLVTIRYIAKYIFCINISNDSPKIIVFWLNQLAFPSGKKIMGDCAIRKNFLAMPKSLITDLLLFTKVKRSISLVCFFLLVLNPVIVRLAKKNQATLTLLVIISRREQKEQLRTIKIDIPAINLIGQLHK